MQLFFRPTENKYEGEGILPHGTFNNTNDWNPLIKYLEKGAIEFPDKTMFKMGDGNGKIIEQFTYKETNQRANQIANYLIENCSIQSEDKIGIFMLNSSEFVFSILATHKTGAIQVPVNKDEKGERLLYVINYSEMKVLVIDKRDHIGGNCYDYHDEETNILMNKYGAHLFHTNHEEVFSYSDHIYLDQPAFPII